MTHFPTGPGAWGQKRRSLDPQAAIAPQDAAAVRKEGTERFAQAARSDYAARHPTTWGSGPAHARVRLAPRNTALCRASSGVLGSQGASGLIIGGRGSQSPDCILGQARVALGLAGAAAVS